MYIKKVNIHMYCMLWKLFQTHYHTLPHPKTKENKIQTKDKIEPQRIYIWLYRMDLGVNILIKKNLKEGDI